MSRIEALLETAAKATTKTAENMDASNAHYEERFDKLDTSMDTMAKAIAELAASVKEHHASMHLKDLLKSAKAWTIGFFAFAAFHAGAEYIQQNGGSWIEMFLKLIGVK